MDIDTTVKGLPVSTEEIRRIVTEIGDIQLGDNVTFQINNIATIMDEADYSGLRLNMSAMLDESVVPMKIDISTGDAITPSEICYDYALMFKDRSILIMAYPIETILAEKIEATLSRSTANTRMRDFYDLFLLSKTQAVDVSFVRQALDATAKKRSSSAMLEKAEITLLAIEQDADMRKSWIQYAKKNLYAGSVSWDEVTHAVRHLCCCIGLVEQKKSIMEVLKATSSERHPLSRQKKYDAPEL